MSDFRRQAIGLIPIALCLACAAQSSSPGSPSRPTTSTAVAAKHERVEPAEPVYTPATILQVVSPHLSSITACYTDAMVNTAVFSQHTVAEMVVSPEGKVVESELFANGNDALDACTRRVLDRILFPPHPSAETVRVHFPLLFVDKPQPQVLGRCDLDHQAAGANKEALLKYDPTRAAQAVDAGASAPRARRARSGSLDKEIIRRVIRRNIGPIRLCYERQLDRNPKLAGRISTLFTIAGDGSVQKAQTQSSTMNDTDVEDCIVRAVCNWRFPEPNGKGYVVVSYPFNFTSSQSE
jgi:outer membrane biosynthesis protein TonB